MNILESPSRTCAFVWFHADSGQRLSKGIYRISGFCALTLRVAATGQTYWVGLSRANASTTYSVINRENFLRENRICVTRFSYRNQISHNFQKIPDILPGNREYEAIDFWSARF